MEWSTACPDWEKRIVAGEPLIVCPTLFPDEAADARRMFDLLRLVDVRGEPAIGEISRPWLKQFADAVFGSYDPISGRRLIREFMLLVAKKNAKSTIAAAIMLTALLRTWRKSGELLILAPTIEIANNSFFPARDMVRADPELSDLLHIQDHYRTITHRATNSVLKVVAAENETVAGKKASVVLIDELWQFGKRANAENMLREATGGLASRPEGCVIYLSTHSDEAPAGVFKQKLGYFRGVRDGRIKDKRALPVLYEFPNALIEDESFKRPDRWRITNPNLGASVDEEFIERELAKAENSGEESLRGFYAKHLNVEIGLRILSDAWVGATYWERRGDKSLTLEALIDRSDIVCIGVDGGGLDDLLGLAILGRDAVSRQWLLTGHSWAHNSVLERRKSEASRLRDFARAGELTIVERLGQDIDELADIVEHVDASGKLYQVGFDPFGVGAIVDALAERGVAGDSKVVSVTQGWRLTGAIKTTERKLADGTLVHSGSGLMTWAVGNAKVEPRGNAIVITKQASGTAKIDPLMAAFDAVALMATNPGAAMSTAYTAEGGLIVL